jgi:hypothetical protein
MLRIPRYLDNRSHMDAKLSALRTGRDVPPEISVYRLLYLHTSCPRPRVAVAHSGEMVVVVSRVTYALTILTN